MSLIKIRQLSVGYEGMAVEKNISFQVEAGDYLCIVGENGSGKSTLMKTILQLQKPIGGEILYGDGLRQNEVGYLPQQTMVQKDFPATVWEIVLSGFQGSCRLRPFYSGKEKEVARENLKRMGILELSGRCYRELSGGQQQRVLLARALCATRKILFLDEPISGLDPKAAAEMYELIAGLNHEGIAILMISHDIVSVIDYASHILHVGNTIFFGTKEEYLDSEVGKHFCMREGMVKKQNG